MDKKRLIYYIYDKKLIEASNNIPNLKNRATVVQSLIASYNLLAHCEVCNVEETDDENLLSFHSTDYIECLKRIQLSGDLEKMMNSDEVLEFNLGYDCPLFDNMYDFAKIIAGASLVSARKLISQYVKVKKTCISKSYTNSLSRSYLCLKDNPDMGNEKNFRTIEHFVFEEEKPFDNKHSLTTTVGNNLKKKIKFEIEFQVPFPDVQPIAINWFGGWHHAQRDEAGGFCYVNDIVIAVQYLSKFFKRILYIDLDIHHGNGVESAFIFSSRVLTLSFHKFEPGYYPTTGSVNDIGKGNGMYYTVNVPLKSGITDEKYFNIFKIIFLKVMEKYEPQCLVVQCGADCLSGDPLGGFNMTPLGMGDCLKCVLDEKLPTLVLGGGGYNIVNTSKCWTYLTSIILGNPISNDIPDHPFLHAYGPDYDLRMTPGLRKDENSDDYLKDIVQRVLCNLDNLPVN